MDKNLLLFINDPKVFFIFSKKLKEKGIKWIGLESASTLPNYIPKGGSVIVSESEGIENIKKEGIFGDAMRFYSFINYEKFPNFDSLLIHVIKKIRGIEIYSTLSCAIDPGQKNIGIAYFLDEKFLITEIMHRDIEVVERINFYILSLRPNKIKIKIGSGNLRSLRDLISLFLGNNMEKDVELYLVNEYGTSKKRGPKFYYDEIPDNIDVKNKSNDEIAAITIGLREGKILTFQNIEKILNKEAPKSELKHIQRLSRKESSGELSLSRKLAQEVYLGKITMESAIEIQKKKNNNGEY